jgi:hypothetical protein
VSDLLGGGVLTNISLYLPAEQAERLRMLAEAALDSEHRPSPCPICDLSSEITRLLGPSQRAMAHHTKAAE